MKIEINNAPSGSNTLLTAKSTRSKTVLSKNFTSAITPYDKQDGIPTMKIAIPIIQVNFFRFEGSFFVIVATIISIIENAEVKAANKNKSQECNEEEHPKGHLIEYCW